jgi:hypothetical protein
LANRVHRNEAQVQTTYYYSMNLFFLISYPIYLIVTIIWFYLERHKTLFLRKRSLLGICAEAVGSLTIYVLGPVRNLNSGTFSCDLMIICVTMCVPVVMTPLALRLYQFKTSLDWNKHLAKTSMTKLNMATGYEDGRHTTTGITRQRKKSILNGAKNVAFVVSASTSENSGNSAAVEDQTSLTSSGNQLEKVTLGLWFRSSDAFMILLASTIYILYFLGLSLPILLTKPHYLHGCTGCLHHADEQGAAFAASMVVGNLFLLSAWNIRHEQDPLEIKSEVYALSPGSMIIGTVGALGILVDVLVNAPQDTVEDRAIVQWEWFLLLTCAWIHFCQCPLQIIRARRFGKLVGVLPSTPEFITMLENPTFFKLFEARCVSEFSVENLKFYKSVESEFKVKYHTMKGPDRDAVAEAIFNAYVSTGAVMEINIMHSNRKPLEVFFHQENVKDVPINIFDDALEEIVDLMKRDSLARWVKTKEYNDWATRSVVVKNGVLTVMS